MQKSGGCHFLAATSIPVPAECICHAIHPDLTSAMPMKYHDSVRITIEVCLRAAVMGAQSAAKLRQNRRLRAGRFGGTILDHYTATAPTSRVA